MFFLSFSVPRTRIPQIVLISSCTLKKYYFKKLINYHPATASISSSIVRLYCGQRPPIGFYKNFHRKLSVNFCKNLSMGAPAFSFAFLKSKTVGAAVGLDGNFILYGSIDHLLPCPCRPLADTSNHGRKISNRRLVRNLMAGDGSMLNYFFKDSITDFIFTILPSNSSRGSLTLTSSLSS